MQDVVLREYQLEMLHSERGVRGNEQASVSAGFSLMEAAFKGALRGCVPEELVLCGTELVPVRSWDATYRRSLFEHLK